MKPVLIRQHLDLAPPGLLATWLEARGMSYEVSRSWLNGRVPDLDRYAFVASLGHERGVGDTDDAAVAAELALLERAVARGVPVLGLCFGGQVLAAALGGRVERAPVPELGWVEIDTDDAARVPAGPWLEWHFDRFAIPPGGHEIARSAGGSQAFRLGPHLGVQFHPEATVEIVERWARLHGRLLPGLGIADAAALLDASPQRREAAAAAAFRLFDAFVEGFTAAGGGSELAAAGQVGDQIKQ